MTAQEARTTATRRLKLKRYLAILDIPFDRDESTASLRSKVMMVHRHRNAGGRLRNAWPAHVAEAIRKPTKRTVSRSIRQNLPRQTWRRQISDQQLLRIVRRYFYLKGMVAMLSMGSKGLTFVGTPTCSTIADLIRENVVPQRLACLDKYLDRMVEVYNRDVQKRVGERPHLTTNGF